MTEKEKINMKEEFIRSLRKDKICDRDEEPLALLIYGSFIEGPNFRKACKFAGINKNDLKAKAWWENLHKNGFMTTKRIFFSPDSKESGIEFCLAMNVAKGYIKMLRSVPHE